MLFPYFVYIAHFTNFTCESFFLKEKSLLVENHERKEVVGEKNKKIKKKRLKEERKSTNLSRKEKNFLCESDWCWRSSTLAFRVWIKKSPSNQNLLYTMLKTRFPFLYASTSLDAKTFVYKTLASDRNFESCMSIRCLAPQHILQFFHFCRGCFLCIGNFAHHCVVLLNAPLSDRDKKKKLVCNGFLFPGNLGP